MPSFGFSNITTAFTLAGVLLVFVYIEPSTMNLDASAVVHAVNDNSTVIVALHYAGSGCNMAQLSELAEKNNLLIVDDAAQGIVSNYGTRPLATIRTFDCISFHKSENIHCGEGDASVINDPRFVERAEMILEKGTNRIKFMCGGVSKYTWSDLGSSYLLSDFN